MMNRVNQIMLVGLLAASLPFASLATSDDRDQPIKVEADRLEVRDDENISIYSGNVRLDQGSLSMRSDQLIIHFNNDRDLVLMEMTGTPATYRQLNDDNKEMLGQADKLDYHEAESLLILTGNARFSSDGDVIESSTIRLNTETDYIEAASPNPEDRVRMVIQPKSNKELQ